jgi:hypothetical protein
MRTTITILGIATIILWIITIFFIVTSVYSVLQLGIRIGGVQMLPSSEGGINFSLPFSIINNGYYEITDLNLTTRITDPNGTLSVQSQTIVPSIPQGTIINATHRVPIDLDTLTSIDHLSLLLNDSSFDVELFAALNFARAIPIEVSTNATVPWGAPLSHFNIGTLSHSSYNSTHGKATVNVSFGNHAVLDLVGTLKLEYYDNSQELIAYGQTSINVPAETDFQGEVNSYPLREDIPKLNSSGGVHVIFETPMFVVEWEELYG